MDGIIIVLAALLFTVVVQESSPKVASKKVLDNVEVRRNPDFIRNNNAFTFLVKELVRK